MTFEIYNIEPPLEGATLSNGDILVNVELIWTMFPNEDAFIKEFGDIYTHEVIHKVLRTIISDHEEFPFGEELAVRMMLGQPFTIREKRFYNDKEKATTITYRRVKKSHK